jgi:hypothetical protein
VINENVTLFFKVREESYLAIEGIIESCYVLLEEILIHMRERSPAVTAAIRAKAKEKI